MKKIILTLILSLIMITTFSSYASNNAITPVNPESEIIQRNQILYKRLEEINRTDKATLSRSEKRDLRKEVKEIERTMAVGGGVYLSIGAIILILILLIILL